MSDAVVDHSKKVIDDLDSLLSQLHCQSASGKRNLFGKTPGGSAPSPRPQSSSSCSSERTNNQHSSHNKNQDDKRASAARELDALLQELSQAKKFNCATAAKNAPDPEDRKSGEILNRTAYLSLSPSQLSKESKANVENLLAELHTVIRASPSKIKNQQVNPNFASYTNSNASAMPGKINAERSKQFASSNNDHSNHSYDQPYSLSKYSDPDRNRSFDGGLRVPEDAEIDELYSSISEVVGPRMPYNAPERTGPMNSNLDCMLGNLEADLNVKRRAEDGAGVGGGLLFSNNPDHSAEVLFCAHCKELISDQSISALGMNWHLEHFVCAECHQELGTKNFFEFEGKPFCETDYHRLFSPKCAHCALPILEKCVTALDQTWHPEHFCCSKCERLFAPNEGFHEVDGKPYCREDYFELFAPKCKACLNPIMENFISALQAHWHPDCFVCQDCHMPFGNGSFFEHMGWPCCETHYHSRRGSLCAGCGKPISSGKCVTALYKKFHPEHFVCAFCLKQLSATFKEQNDKPYCHACFDKLFS